MSDNNGWKKVGGDNNNVPAWKPEKVGDEVSGIYVDVKEVTRTDKTTSKIYTLQQPDGGFVGVWGSAIINDRMSSVPLGDEVKIVFLGKGKTKTGYNINQFDIFQKSPDKSEETAQSSAVEDENDEIPF